MPSRAGSIVLTTADRAGSAFRTTGGFGGEGGTSEKLAWIPKIRIPCTSRIPQRTSLVTAEGPSPHSKARREETTTTNFGLIPTSRGEWLSAAIKGRS